MTRKITRGMANISQGIQDCLYMGNINALRDWGHAKDYVAMQWLMLQQDSPRDFVIASGKQYSIRTFILWSAAELGIKIGFEGEGVDELGRVECVEGESAKFVSPGQIVIRIDPKYFRPAEVSSLQGDATEAREKLGWTPTISAKEMCAEMVQNDLKAAQRRRLLLENNLALASSIEI